MIKIIKFELTAKATAIENIPELLRHIASLVEEGFLSGTYPEWNLIVKEIEEEPGEL